MEIKRSRNPSPPEGYVFKPCAKVLLKEPPKPAETYLYRHLMYEKYIQIPSASESSSYVTSSDEEVAGDHTNEIQSEPMEKEEVQASNEAQNDISELVNIITQAKAMLQNEVISSHADTDPVEKIDVSKIKIRSSDTESDYSNTKHSKKKKKQKKKSSASKSESDTDSSEKERRKRKGRHIKIKSERSDSDESYDQRHSAREYQNSPGRHTSDDAYRMFGSDTYFCKYCNASMNSEATWQSHVIGKRHKKAVKAYNIADIALESISHEDTSKYPNPPQGYRRVVINERSYIQDLIDDGTLGVPCPGLEKLIEIRIQRDVSYYCRFCDASCSAASIFPHLRGYRHQMKCLKYYEPDLHERYELRKKSDVESKVIEALIKIEVKQGRGSIIVEVEKSDRSAAHHSQPSTSGWVPPAPVKFKSETTDTDSQKSDFTPISAPDKSKSDFYCSTCDSHMNSYNMWVAHSRGKRHLKNIKKAPGENKCKAKTMKSDTTRAKLYRDLDEVFDPIVGLNYIRETQNDVGEMYNCYLCGACCTSVDVIDHLLSSKHRRKYLEKVKDTIPNSIDMIAALEVSATDRDCLIQDECKLVEEKHGRGDIEVYVTKTLLPPPSKRW